MFVTTNTAVTPEPVLAIGTATALMQNFGAVGTSARISAAATGNANDRIIGTAECLLKQAQIALPPLQVLAPTVCVQQHT